MNRDKLVNEYEKETGNRFNVECVVYNDYVEWLEDKLTINRSKYKNIDLEKISNIELMKLYDELVENRAKHPSARRVNLEYFDKVRREIMMRLQKGSK